MEQRPCTIGVFISSHSIGEELRGIAREQRDLFRLSYEGLEEAVDVGRQMEAEGVEVIVSRRGTAHLLRENLHVPVLSFPQSSLSTLTSIRQAADMLPLPARGKKKVFMPNFRNVISGLEIVGELLDIDFQQGIYTDSASLRRIISDAADQGFGIIVGGTKSMQHAREFGIGFQELLTPRENIIETIENARSAARASREEKATAKRYQSIMDLSSDAIIAVDDRGNLALVTKKARAMFAIKDNQLLGQPFSAAISSPDIRKYLREKQPVHDAIEDCGNELCLYSQLPLIVSDQPAGIVATFKEAASVIRAESKVRRRLTRGFIARYVLDDLVYRSPVMKKLTTTCREFARTDSTVLVMGETGTGKEVMAQSIHNLSRRKHMPFVSVHCGALPEQLLESELFGYEEGAFTGSRRGGKPGLFEIAHQGTIFLDEIDSTTMNVQLRLLRVLQEREVMRVGGDRKIPIDVRVVTAAGKDLWGAVTAGTFRKDLFFRINVLRLTCPPLRQRQEDIPLLLDHFLHHYRRKHGIAPVSLPDWYIHELTSYPWPGNIRQLKHFSEQLLLNSSFQHREEGLKSILADLYNITEKTSKRDEEIVKETPLGLLLSDPQTEADHIRKALEEAGYSKTRAAKLLGISRTTLWRKLQQLQDNKR